MSLLFTQSSPLILRDYYHVDWAGDIPDKPTSGCTSFGDSLIS